MSNAGDHSGQAVARLLDGLVRGVEGVLTGFAYLWAGGILLAVPMVAYVAARSMAEVGDPVIKTVGILATAALLVAVLLLLRSGRNMGESHAIWAVVIRIWLYGATAAMLAVGLFASVTFWLAQDGYVALHPQPRNGGEVADFFMYHLIGAVPGNIPSTLRWSAPFDYDQARVGLLVLLFNLVVVASIAKFVRDELRRTRDARAAEAVASGSAAVDEGQGA